MPPRTLLLFAASFGLLAVAGCDAGPAAGLPDDEGTPYGADVLAWGGDWSWGDIVWSPDGREVYYRAGVPGSFAVEAADVEAETTRVVATGLGWPAVLRVSPDGGTLYVWDDAPPAGDHDAAGIYRIPAQGGTPERVLDQADPAPFALSADGTRLAYGGADTVRIHDLVGGSTVATDLDPWALSFSPDATRLLHGTADAELYVSTVDGSDTATLWTRGAWERTGGMRWDPDGIELLYLALGPSGPIEVFVRDGRTGADRGIAEIVAGEDVGATTAAWSPGGRHVAIWDGAECLDHEGWACVRVQYLLHLVDVVEGTTEVFGSTQASVSAAPPSALTFSPDATRVAYVAHDRLWVKPVP